MATVFLAQDLEHDRPIALNVLHPELAATRLAVGERTRAFRASRG
jgi:hypothetical protein